MWQASKDPIRDDQKYGLGMAYAKTDCESCTVNATDADVKCRMCIVQVVNRSPISTK